MQKAGDKCSNSCYIVLQVVVQSAQSAVECIGDCKKYSPGVNVKYKYIFQCIFYYSIAYFNLEPM